jgi:hypothetical protein
VKKFFVPLALLPLGLGNLLARPPAIADVVFERHCAADFLRVFHRSPAPRHRQFLHRTDNARWDGLYAIVLLGSRRGWEGATLEWELLRLGCPEARSATIPLDPAGLRGRELWLGLTDGPWGFLAPEDVVAWRVRILRNGTVLAERASFLFPGTEPANSGGTAAPLADSPPADPGEAPLAPPTSAP